jgi:hypothetical protein
MPYILHDDLPGLRPNVIDAAAWVRAGWRKDPDQADPPVVTDEEDEPEAKPAPKSAEQPARLSKKEL